MNTGEPWVHLDDGAALENWGRENEIAYNQRNRQRQKLEFYRNAFDFLTDNRISGDYMEFGCHRARTFRMALTEARKHNLGDMKFWAFDSFEGLPPTDEKPSIEHWQAGALKTDVLDFQKMLGHHGIYRDNIRIVKGFYADTLKGDFISSGPATPNKAMLITVDCDLYESAVPVFEFIDDYLRDGTVIYLDDLLSGFKGNPNKGVAKAFEEYQAVTKWRFQPHMNIGWWGRSYIASVPA